MTAEEILYAYYVKTRMSQPELAEALNVSQTTIHNWLSGKKKIPMEHFYNISQLCGCDLRLLLPEDWLTALE